MFAGGACNIANIHVMCLNFTGNLIKQKKKEQVDTGAELEVYVRICDAELAIVCVLHLRPSNKYSKHVLDPRMPHMKVYLLLLFQALIYCMHKLTSCEKLW